jgi:hypothetical protein
MTTHPNPQPHNRAAYEILLKEMKRQEMGTWDNQHFRRGSATNARKQAEAVINQQPEKTNARSK